MILRIVLQGKAQALADKVQVPTIADFTIDGQIVLPTKGHRVTLRRLDSAEGAWLHCTGRRFDLNEPEGPVIYLGLE